MHEIDWKNPLEDVSFEVDALSFDKRCYNCKNKVTRLYRVRYRLAISFATAVVWITLLLQIALNVTHSRETEDRV